MHRSGCGNVLVFFAMFLRTHVVYIKVLYTAVGFVDYRQAIIQPILFHKRNKLRVARQLPCLFHYPLQLSLRDNPTSSDGSHIHTQMPVPYSIALSRAPMLYINNDTIRYSMRLFLMCPIQLATVKPVFATSAGVSITCITPACC